jgi:hypothetical protein
MSISDLADATTALSECDLSQDLTAVLGQLSDLIAKEKEQQETQAKMDVIHLLNCGDEYLRTIGSVRVSGAAFDRMLSALVADAVLLTSARVRIPDQVLPHVAGDRSRHEEAEGST